MEERELDVLWVRYVGSRHMFAQDELKVLNQLRRGKILPFQKVQMLYYTSKVWKAIRRRRLEKDNYRCVECGSDSFVHVDHKRYPKKFGDEGLEDLQTLCWRCHAVHTKKYDLMANKVTPKQKVRLTENRQIFSALRFGESVVVCNGR